MCNSSGAVDAARNRPNRSCSETEATCAHATIRFISDDGDADTGNDATLDFVNISNRLTSDNLPNGFGPNADGTADPDHFKIEIDDTDKGGGTIAAAEVTLEVLKPNAAGELEPFNPPRRLQVECRRVSGSTGGTENKYRSRYLRLVTDTEDQNEGPDQCLLADWDSTAPDVEILDQTLRVTYPASNGVTLTREAAVGQESDQRRLRLVIHVVRQNPGVAGSGPVTPADATTRLRKWFRRCYAQACVSPKLMAAVDEVDPPRNLLVVSNNAGANAAGNADNWMRFFIRDVEKITYTVVRGDSLNRIAQRHEVPNWNTIYSYADNADFRLLRPNPNLIHPGDQIVIPAHNGRVAVVYHPPSGESPLQTAEALAQRVQTAGLTGRAFQNAPRPGDAQGSADFLVTRADGSRVTLEDESSQDNGQTLYIARVTATDFLVSSNDAAGGFATHNIGTAEQRALVRNYRGADDRLECFVVDTVRYDNDPAHYIRGRAVLPNAFRPAAEQPELPLLRSTYTAGDTMDGTDNNPFTFPHECGHVVMDVFHAGENHQMMRSGTSGNNGVAESKRIYNTNVAFDGMGAASPLDQVSRLRTSGAPVLEGW